MSHSDRIATCEGSTWLPHSLPKDGPSCPKSYCFVYDIIPLLWQLQKVITDDHSSDMLMCVFAGTRKEAWFSKEAESVLFMLRNKNTYPLQENKRRQKKKSNAHRVTSMIDWLSLNSDSIEVKLGWTRKYCHNQEDREYISESISSIMRSLAIEKAKGRQRKRTRVKEELLLYGG